MKKLIPLLMLVGTFVAGCTCAPIIPTVTSQLPVINSFSATPAAISAGESSTLSWTVTGATTVSIDQGIGSVALSGTRAVAPAVTTTYTLTATSSAGNVPATTQVIVSTPAPTPATLPIINFFTASPSSVSLGGSSNLSWNVSNATSVMIDNGVGPVGSSGNIMVLPTATTTFTLTASSPAGSSTASTIVFVSGTPSPPSGLPVINYFTANPNSLLLGGSSTLSWSVSNATSISITPGIGNVGATGSVSVTPGVTTNYVLTASNPAGSVYDTVQVKRIFLEFELSK